MVHSACRQIVIGSPAVGSVNAMGMRYGRGVGKDGDKGTGSGPCVISNADRLSSEHLCMAQVKWAWKVTAGKEHESRRAPKIPSPDMPERHVDTPVQSLKV